MVLFNNKTLLRYIFSLDYGSLWAGLAFKLSTVALAVSLMHLVLNLFFALGWTRPILIFFVFTAAAADFFMGQYGVLIDSGLIASVFETTKGEAGQYLSFQYLFSLIVFALIFSVVLMKLRFEPVSWKSRWWQALKVLVFNLTFIAVLGGFTFKEYASFFRNNRQVRHMFNPINTLYETFRYTQTKYFPKQFKLTPIGLDASFSPDEENPRKRFVVFVLGETARADHFSLNKYERETNPAMKTHKTVSFKDAWSCGTATAVSVPCLFSDLTRSGFSEDVAEHRENLLDVVQRAGYHVSWLDNNTGCKGVCNRVTSVDLTKYWTPDLCKDGLCFDEVLLKPLQHLANNQGVDHFIVLHMVGSHGPTYSSRYPKEFAAFQPECETNQLIDCTREQVINTYDNTIIYTDHVLGEVVTFLEGLQSKFDTAMVYVSDHGESLGENGIYLHSLPYSLAPDEQKHIPWIVWTSDGYRQASGLTTAKLQSHEQCHVSHDQVFHSMLKFLNVETKEYKADLDVFNPAAPCD